MKTRTKIGLAAGGALALALAPALNAFADVQAQTNDIVGVGSDTLQYLGDFIADGDASGHAGYNSTHLTARIVNYDATGDSYGGLTTGSGAVLRIGQKPINRPDGSGTGEDALNADTSNSIQYTRASTTPNSTRQGVADTNFQGYHAYRVATDDLNIATASTTNVPANLTGAQLLTIFEANKDGSGNCPTWASLSLGTSTDQIHPELPQSGSGTLAAFTTDLQNTYNGGVAVPIGNCVTTTQENDPRPIAGNPDAVAPFSHGRITLVNSGYFSANSSIVAGAVVLQAGTFPAARHLYILVRQSDYTANKSFLSALFAAGTGAYTKAAASSLYASSGLTKSFADCVTPDTYC